MKHTKIKALLLGIGASALLVAGASANTITLGNISQALGGPGSLWTYDIAYSNSRLVAGDYFTIMDFGPATVVTPPAAPAGGTWTLTQVATGPSPYLPGTVPDNAVLNATFTYAGPTASIGDLAGQTFTLGSVIPSVVPIVHDYVSIDHADSGLTAGLISRATGPIATPVPLTPVPDGGTTLMMLGSAFAALGALRRKLKS